MDKHKRNRIEGDLNKAQIHLNSAREHVKNIHYSESVQASQVCIEFSVKSILDLLEVECPPRHKWGEKQLANIAKQIRDKQILEKPEAQYIHVPRLLFLLNFWGEFYISAKYGFEEGDLAPARDLIRDGEAKLAVQHAEECWLAASQVFDQITRLPSVQE
jgi:HEPN domain-containing protein